MRKSMYRVSRLAVALVYTATLLVGALFATVPTALAEETAYIRFLHAAPKLSNVDILIDGKAYKQNFAFGALTANFSYDAYSVGKHSIAVTPTGKSEADAVIKKDVTFDKNASYTLAAVGTTSDDLEILVFTDNNNVEMPGLAKTRFYHLCADCGSLDVTLSQLDKGVKNVTYKTATDYLYVPAGHYTIQGKLGNGQTVPFEIDLEANETSSAFAVGLIQGEPRLQLVGSRIAQNPQLPNTGSDPNAPKAQAVSWPLMALVAGIVLLGLGGGATVWKRRSLRSQRKTN